MSTPKVRETICDSSLAKLFRLAKVAVLSRGDVPDDPVSGLSDDSRRVGPGCCFVAVRGTSVDGHDFVAPAIGAGATAVVVERTVPVPGDAVCLRVEDTREALAKLAAAFYGLRGDASDGLRLVGVTGTNGKTTVTWLLRSILSAAGHRPALLGTVEYDLVQECRPSPLTTPGALELCRYLATAREAGARFAVLEVSSHALEQRRCDGLQFAVAVFTNLSGDHLDYHGTMESYAAAKRRLFGLLEDGRTTRGGSGVAVLNTDDAVGRGWMGELAVPVVSYGLDSREADVRAQSIGLNRWGSRFTLGTRSGERDVQTNLIGRHNILNVLASVATAEALGLPPDLIQKGIEQFTGVPGRLQRVEPRGWPFSVLVDYAHTDAALRHVVQALRPLTGGRLVVVFGCGGDRDRTKRPRMGAAVAALADVAYVTSDNPRTEDPHEIIAEILPGFRGSTSCTVHVEPDRRAAIHAAVGLGRPGDTVLIAGKGHEDYQILGSQTVPFDDVLVARQCLGIHVPSENVA